MSVLKNCDFYVAFMNIVSGTLCIFILSGPHHHVQVEDYHYNPIIIIYVVPWDLFASLTKAWCLFKGLTWPCRDSKGILIVCSFMSLCLVENTSSVKYPKLLYHVKSGSLFTEQFCLSATANSVVTIVFRGGATGGQGRDKGGGYSVLTSLSFHRPGMQKDSRRSLPHRSKMRNSTDDKQAGGKRHVLSKQQHVYWIQTNTAGARRPEDTTQESVQAPKRRLTDLLVSHRRPQVRIFIWQWNKTLQYSVSYTVNVRKLECATRVLICFYNVQLELIIF